MILLIIFLAIASIHTHKVFESNEDIELPEINITHLYPTNLNITSIKSRNIINEEQIKVKEKETNRVKDTESMKETFSTQHIKVNQSREETTEEIIKTHDEIKYEYKPLDKTNWKIETSFAESNLTQKDNNDKVESKNLNEKFKPSQLLGYIVEEVTPRNSHEDFSLTVTRPYSEIISSPNDEYNPPINNRPEEILQSYKLFPYKFYSYTKPIGSWSPDTLDEHTKETPVQLPAGDLYQLTHDFNKHSELSVYHKDLGYGIKPNFREHLIRKPVDPWKNLVRLMTALVPAGLLISALTPSIINISPGPDNYYPSKLRRSDTSSSLEGLESISERCRRRLLCELHSERNYTQYISSPSPVRRHKQCHKVYCEDTQALYKMLRWLLSYHKPADNRKIEMT